MAFDPNEFFDLSKRLIGALGQTEVVLRTAVGRAYYAAFLSARAKSPPHLLTVGRGPSDAHWIVRSAMKRINHPEIASKLETLATIRRTCDYDMSTPVTQTDFDEAIQLAENVLQLIGGI
jgi:uncharacterized protein (UPF0332 family)